MLIVSTLRLCGIFLGLGSFFICFRKLKSYSDKRTDVGLIFLLGSALFFLGLFPSLANIPASFLKMDGYQWGRIITLLLISNVFFWLLFLVQRGRSEKKYAQFDDFMRQYSVATFFKYYFPADIQKDILIVIPAYNEAQNLEIVLPRIPKIIESKSVGVLVVDDGSSDETVEVSRKFNAMVVSHLVNRGGGSALKTGYALAIQLAPDVVVTMDADGQHDPGQVERLVGPVLADEADFVIGSRILGINEGSSGLRLAGIRIFSRLINWITDTEITDCSSGFRAMNGKIFKKCQFLQEQYHTAETIIEAAKRGFRIIERPVTIVNRLNGESKKGHNFKYGFFFLRTILRTWLR